MKKLILISLLLSFSNAKQQYLESYQAHKLIQNGYKVRCYDKETRKYYLLKKDQYVFPAGGIYFYNVNKEPVTTNMCIQVK